MTPTKFFIVAAGLIPFEMLSQVAVADYPKEIRCPVEEMTLIAPVTASSDAGPVETKMEDQLFSGGCMGTLVRTYVFTDPQGNTARAEQYIFLSDDKAPQLINVPADITADAGKIPVLPVVTCVDNSGRAYEVQFSESRSGNSVSRTWTCTDSCDNTVKATQVITLTGS